MEEKEEYASMYTSGNMLVFTDDEVVEEIYPLKDRVKRAQLEGQKVYKRKIQVIEDWVEVD